VFSTSTCIGFVIVLLLFISSSFLYFDHPFYFIEGFNPSNAKSAITYELVKSWGSYGTGNGQFQIPTAIAIDSSTGNIYVGDFDNDRIQKFDSNGNFITKWEYYVNEDRQLYSLVGIGFDIAIDSQNNMHVADSNNNYIQVFTPAK